MPGSFRVARILGIDIRIHISWVLIFLLVLLSLADQVFPDWYPQWSQQKTFLISAIAALLFFTSVLLHELAHAIVALRFKMSVSSITLFLLGGVANLTKEPPSAKAEFFMASAGPLTSLTIGALAFLVQQLVTNNIDVVPSLQPVEGVARYLSFINIAVALFNLVPGFPLDGGRVLRSIIWGVRRDRVAATRIAARGGQLVAGLMVVYGVSRALDGEAMTGLWMFLIAYFLYGAASQSLQQERVTAAVGSVRVAQLMTTNFRSAPAGISIGQLIRDIVLPNNLQAIPIVARQFKMSVSSITLFLLGGVANLTKEPPSARAEFFMASAGPLTSLTIGVLFRDAVVGYVRMQETLGLDARR